MFNFRHRRSRTPYPTSFTGQNYLWYVYEPYDVRKKRTVNGYPDFIFSDPYEYRETCNCTNY
jgi:hypothetical protein